MRRWILVLCAIVAACAAPKMPQAVPRSGRAPSARSLIPRSELQAMWGACLDLARQRIADGAIDCGELSPGASGAALRCSFDSAMSDRPFFVRGLAAGAVSTPYLLVGDGHGTVAHVQCDWTGATLAFLEYRCPRYKLAFTRDAILCNSADAPWWFQQKRLDMEDNTIKVHPKTFRDEFERSAASARWNTSGR